MRASSWRLFSARAPVDDPVFLGQGPVKVPQSQMGFYPGQDFRGVEGADNIVHGPEIKAPGLLVRFFHGCNENYGNVPGPGIGLELIAYGKAVHAGHDNIQKDQVWKLFFQALQCGFPIFGDGEAVMPFKGGGQDIYICGAVIHDHDQVAVHGLPFELCLKVKDRLPGQIMVMAPEQVC